MIKAIFFDIDGTLVDFATRKMPESTKAALKQLREKKIKLFIASGRPPRFMRMAPEHLENFPFDGYVLTNGQCCTDAEMKPFYLQALPRKTFLTLNKWLEENPDVVVSFVEDDFSYLNRTTPEFLEFRKNMPFRQEPVCDPARALDHTTYQINPYIGPEREKEFLAHAPGVKSVRWNNDFADIIPEDGGKEKGIQRMLDRFEIDRSECMAFGDGGNDITMLRYCAIGVAMGNATPDVKEAADYVTDAIGEDGLANALKHFGLIEA